MEAVTGVYCMRGSGVIFVVDGDSFRGVLSERLWCIVVVDAVCGLFFVVDRGSGAANDA